MKGKLIVFEGTDGSGKATQSRLLCDELTRRGISFRKLEFPRYKEESSALIRLYLGGAFGDKPGDVNAYAASVFSSIQHIPAGKCSQMTSTMLKNNNGKTNHANTSTTL